MPKKRPSTHFETAHSSAQRWPRRTGMPSVFTAFVSGLRGEATPDADLFHDAWHALRAALVDELKRRGLWQSSPCYLGVCGWERWDAETPDAGSHGQVSALAELVADCYAFIFVDRLSALKRQLETKPAIDGLVVLNVRHFLHERQKEHDPLGFRIFELLQSAVEEALASGTLHRLAGDRKVRNDTLLGFDPAAEPPPTPLDLEPIVMRWNNVLLPGLITAQSRQQVTVVRQLGVCLLELRQHGIESFRFKDLLDPLKRDARRRWAAFLAGEDEKGTLAASPDGALALAVPRPESEVETRQSFEHLTRSIATSIDRLETDSRTRTQLSTLWHYLQRHHGEEDQEDASGLAATGENHPSYRQLGQSLKIPRERFPVLFNLLQRLVACYRTGGGRKAEKPTGSAMHTWQSAVGPAFRGPNPKLGAPRLPSR